MDEKDIVKEIKDKVDAIKAEGEGKVSQDVFDKTIFDLNQKIAELRTIKPVEDKTSFANKFAQDLHDGKEIRNVTQNGAGAIQVVSEIVRGMVDKGKLASKVRVFYGDNAKVNIPVFAPGLAAPAVGAEGSSAWSNDAQAVLAPVSLTPKPFVSILPVDRLALYSTSIEASLIDIFGDAFGIMFDNQIINGAGTNEFTGIFLASWIATVTTAAAGNIKTAASATAVTWKELATLARLIRAKAGAGDNIGLVMHPDVVSSVLTASGAASALELEYLTRGTIASVPVVESTYCPNTFTTGKYVAAAVNFAKYGMALVRDIQVDSIHVKGDSNIYEQGFVYANGQPLVPSDYFYLKLA